MKVILQIVSFKHKHFLLTFERENGFLHFVCSGILSQITKVIYHSFLKCFLHFSLDTLLVVICFFVLFAG